MLRIYVQTDRKSLMDFTFLLQNIRSSDKNWSRVASQPSVKSRILLTPGPNSIKLLQLWLTSISIVSEVANNIVVNYPCKIFIELTAGDSHPWPYYVLSKASYKNEKKTIPMSVNASLHVHREFTSNIKKQRLTWHKYKRRITVWSSMLASRILV